MPRKKRKIRIELPEGVTARDVKAALREIKRTGGKWTPLEIARRIAIEREGRAVAAEAPARDPNTVIT
jgi:hypothetical protein